MNPVSWKILQQSQPVDRHQSIDEINLYLDNPVITWVASNPIYQDPDWVLTWWRANESEFPRLAKAARDLLAVPGAEVDVERLFSDGRDILGLRRNLMSADTMRC